jgi:hypothetical protein
MGFLSGAKDKFESATARDKDSYKTNTLIKGYRSDGLRNIFTSIYNKGEVGDEEEIRKKIDSWLDDHAQEKNITDEEKLESGGSVGGFTHEEAALVAFLYLGERGESTVEYLQGNGPTAFDDETGEAGRLEHLKVLFDEIIALAKEYDLHTLDFNHRPSAMARILDSFYDDEKVKSIVEDEENHSGRNIMSERNEEGYEKVYNEIEDVVSKRVDQKISEYENIDEKIDKAIENRQGMPDWKK